METDAMYILGAYWQIKRHTGRTQTEWTKWSAYVRDDQGYPEARTRVMECNYEDTYNIPSVSLATSFHTQQMKHENTLPFWILIKLYAPDFRNSTAFWWYPGFALCPCGTRSKQMKISRDNQWHDRWSNPQGTGKNTVQGPLFSLLNLTLTVPGSNHGSAVWTWRLAA